MKVPWSWLREYCDPGMDPSTLADRLSMTGTEVERISQRGAPSGAGFVVGVVEAADPHPDADRLKVCRVDVGDGSPRTIVCGAPNVDAGQTVAVALPGAVMPDGQKLGKAKLRGVESSGMILSETEMELGTGSAGIAVLDTDAKPGTALAAILPISETVLELEITPNRPDCLGIYGVAREIHAITGNDLAQAPWQIDPEPTAEGDVHDLASVRVEAPELCPRFTARAFTEVKIGPSPLWLQGRLISAGQRPINNVVDITNYVMLLTGQPLHAFDLDKVPDGEIIVRRATAGEKVTTLDGVERAVDTDTVLVCDRTGPTAIAGVMGGQVSEVSDGTTRVLMEVASWDGPNILTTSNKLGLRSEASSRFEKQLHPELTMRAQAVASRLMIENCGATLVPGTIDVATDGPEFDHRTLELRPDRQTELLGMEIDRDISSDYLKRLGFGVSKAGEGFLSVLVPGDRHFDVTREVDLIEEVARVHGLDAHLPTTLPERGDAVGGLTAGQIKLRRVEDLLRDVGLNEAITWHFVDPGQAEKLGLDGSSQPSIRIHNPISIDQSVMRTNLLGGLLGACSHNIARGAGRVALFESGRVFAPKPPPGDGSALAGNFSGKRAAPATEVHRIGAVVAGPSGPANWRGDSAGADFYDAKGLVELLADSLGSDLEWDAVDQGFLHPGRGARISSGGTPIGWVGEIHPRICERFDLPVSVGFELDLAALLAQGRGDHERYSDVTTFPAIYEDLAVVVPETLPAGVVRAAILEGGGDLLVEAEVFDVYLGDQVGAGNRSLALRLEFRSPERTLTDADVAERRDLIVSELERVGAKLRG